MKVLAPLAALGLMTVALAGCSAGSRGRQEVHVLAASSLTEAFAQIAVDFQSQTGIRVVLSFAGSSSLVRQVKEGADADVIATADLESLRPLKGLTASVSVFARNRLAIATAPDNPLGIATLADLTRVTSVLCGPEVPCGRLSTALLDEAGVTVEPASLELSVKAVLARVQLGEADAGIVYRTDIAAADGLVGSVEVPDDLADRPRLQAQYPAAVLRSGRVELGQRWVEFLQQPDVQAQLQRFGFMAS